MGRAKGSKNRTEEEKTIDSYHEKLMRQIEARLAPLEAVLEGGDVEDIEYVHRIHRRLEALIETILERDAGLRATFDRKVQS